MRFISCLSDINEELITAYKVVKDHERELIEPLKRHQAEYYRNPSEYYYKDTRGKGEPDIFEI
jgi:site-specific DNA-adenine methylase